MSIKKRISRLIAYKLFPSYPNLFKSFNMYPDHIVIEPTNRCNLKCPVCLRNNMNRCLGDMDLNSFKTIIDSIPTLKCISLFFMGESFLNKDIFSMIEYLNEKKIESRIATNSTLLLSNIEKIKNSSLTSLYISLDGLSEETLTKYRVNSNYLDVMNGIVKILEYKSLNKLDTDISIRFLVFSYNEHEIVKLNGFFDIYPDVKIYLVKTILDWGFEKLPLDKRSLLSSNKLLRRYNDDGTLHESMNLCPYVNESIITWDGNVIPCCNDYDAKYIMGNVFEENFYNIFYSKKYNEIRKRMMRKELEICKYCKSVKNPTVKFSNWKML
ncbi:GTP 3',8-cyclase [subsurface metagenome]